MTIEDKIYSFEEENTVIGIGEAGAFYDIEPILESTDTPFVEKDIKKRIDPKLTYDKVKSIVAIGLGYDKKFVGKKDDRLRANISVGAMGLDYHIILKDKLQKLKSYAGIDGLAFVDTGPLVDREVAKRCSLGVAGKSGNIINKKLGSIFFIGYILTDTYLKPTENIYKDIDFCKDCDRCIIACPSGSIKKDGYDYNFCISYLTQKKHIETEKEKLLIRKQIYGCDICQRVCIHNKGVFKENIEDVDIFYPDIEKLLFMSNKEFAKLYKTTACGWRGKKTLQRNAILSLGNGVYSKEAMALLEKKEKDTQEDLKPYIAWAKDKLREKGEKDGIF